MIKYLKIISIIILSLSSINGLHGQSKEEVLELKTIFKSPGHKETYSFAKRPNNELELVFSGFYLGYKYFVSSQDLNVCVFHPSCSTYALLSIQDNGIILGGFAAFDRLTRCNGFSANKYPIHTETHLLYDPID